MISVLWVIPCHSPWMARVLTSVLLIQIKPSLVNAAAAFRKAPVVTLVQTSPAIPMRRAIHVPIGWVTIARGRQRIGATRRLKKMTSSPIVRKVANHVPIRYRPGRQARRFQPQGCHHQAENGLSCSDISLSVSYLWVLFFWLKGSLLLAEKQINTFKPTV